MLSLYHIISLILWILEPDPAPMHAPTKSNPLHAFIPITNFHPPLKYSTKTKVTPHVNAK